MIDLQDKINKFASYGGSFDKPKKAKKTTVIANTSVTDRINSYKHLQSLLSGITESSPVNTKQPIGRKVQLRKQRSIA